MKRISRIIIKAGAFLVLAAVLTTCNTDYFELDRLSDEIELEQELVAPLIYGTFSLDDVASVIDTVGHSHHDNLGQFYLSYNDTTFTLQDTIELTFSEMGIDTAMIQQLDFSLETINEIPVHIDLQLYLLDQDYVLFDSIFDERAVLLDAAQVDSEGRLIEASQEFNVISIPFNKIARTGDLAYLSVAANMYTAGEESAVVKLYVQNTLSYKISIYAKYRINTREL
ncbi:MAG TPA: hypothetical protein ENO20_10965 [Bacteroides sp.]|nr:hypothetical protein [Bacteroides sp.]